MSEQPKSNNLVQACLAVGHRLISVCLPVTVKPFASLGETTTTCHGDTVVKPTTDKCKGSKNNSCTFTIAQDICVKVPVKFGANATAEDTYVDCPMTDMDICKDNDEQDDEDNQNDDEKDDEDGQDDDEQDDDDDQD